MTMTFKKLRPNRVFQNVVDQIQQAILDGRLQAGDQLPSEMKLKEIFNTSRGSVREALRVLEQKGLVRIKTGVTGGAVVREMDTSPISESLDLLIQCQKVSVEHLVEFREQVEGIVAALAAERSSDSDSSSVGRLLERARQLLDAPDGHWEELLDLDVQAHIAIAEMAGNPIFLAVLKMVHENMINAYDWSALKTPTIMKDNFADMEALMEAVSRGRSNEAAFLARYHVRKFHDYIHRSG